VWASVIDFLLPVATFGLLLVPVAMLLGYSLAIVLGMWAFSLVRPLALLAAVAAAILNELVFPHARGWTVGMLLLRLRVPVEQVRRGRILIRSVVAWLSLALAYVGSELGRWELLYATGVHPQSVWWGRAGAPAVAVVGWALVLSWPVSGRTLLDRAAGWHLTEKTGQPLGPAPRPGS
jgi:hypothetical protein